LDRTRKEADLVMGAAETDGGGLDPDPYLGWIRLPERRITPGAFP
jgi:hypothetical protein